MEDASRLEDRYLDLIERNRSRTIFWRDVREILAGLLAVGVMGGASWSAPGWIPKLGGLVVVACVIYVLGRMLRARRVPGEIGEDLPLVERLRAEIRKVDAQAELLGTVRSWYVMPLAVGGTIWVATLVPATGLPPGAMLGGLAAVIGGSVLIFVMVGWLVERLNRAALERGIEPYREELRRMLERAEA